MVLCRITVDRLHRDVASCCTETSAFFFVPMAFACKRKVVCLQPHSLLLTSERSFAYKQKFLSRLLCTAINAILHLEQRCIVRHGNSNSTSVSFHVPCASAFRSVEGAGPVPARCPVRGTVLTVILADSCPCGQSGWHRACPFIQPFGNLRKLKNSNVTSRRRSCCQ